MKHVEAEIEKVIAGHAARNAALRKVFVEKGIDFGEPRLIECHFWTWDGDDAENLALALVARGFRILARGSAATPSDPLLRNVEVGIEQSIELTLRPEFTDDLVRVASSHEGVYDGWGTRI
jgi:regulator of RNase E activity RraB